MRLGADLTSLCPECRQPEIMTYVPTPHVRRPADPDRPPWSLAAALVVLVLFMLTMMIIPAIAVSIWAQLKGIAITPSNQEQILANPQANLVGVVATLIVHGLTLLTAWTVITGWERRFRDVIDWSWHPRFKLRQAVITVVLLYGVAWVLQHFLPSGETAFDKLLQSSQSIRIAVAVLAVVTAPIVEELVYRGVLYPAIQARFGRMMAIVVVAGSFAVVHFMQYWGSALILVSLTLLSFVLTAVRAYTGKLLPCYVIHLFYNLIGVTLILVGYALIK
ncbi:MAG: CPBP family intramembrane metalloprotease [Acidobacteria bacterium]|nr:CPBP family intramembrane metalloprotease [Acidobacteriota bacterium]